LVVKGETVRLEHVRLLLLPALVLVVAATVGGQKPSSQTTEARVAELLSRMTLEEKLSLLSGKGFDTAPIPR
jgi:hypothetical protein